MTIKLSDILGTLPRLSPQERATIRSAIDALGTLTSSSVATPGPQEHDWLLDVINRECVNHGLVRLSLQSMRSRDPAFAGRAEAVQEWLAQNLPNSKHFEQFAIVSLGTQMLIRDLERRHIPVSHLTVMRNFEYIGTCINRAFPGYARSGLLGHVVRGGSQDVWTE